MKRSKRILALFLSMVLLLGMLPMSALAADSTFSDVKTSDWFYDDVRYVCENGLMNGNRQRHVQPKGHHDPRHDRDDPVPPFRRACCFRRMPVLATWRQG